MRILDLNQSCFGLFGLLLLISSSANADRVVDLGEMSLEGEIRRPAINWIDSQKSLKDVLPEYAREEFLALENWLLQPADIEKTVSRVGTPQEKKSFSEIQMKNKTKSKKLNQIPDSEASQK